MNNKYYLIACGVLIAQISIYAANNDGGDAMTPRQQLIPRGRSRSVPDLSQAIRFQSKLYPQGKAYVFTTPRQAMHQLESFIQERQKREDRFVAHWKSIIAKERSANVLLSNSLAAVLALAKQPGAPRSVDSDSSSDEGDSSFDDEEVKR